MRYLLLLAMATMIAGCSPEPGSESWCESKKEQPKSEWTMEDASTFTQHCLISDLTVGSDSWCENLAEKPKGEWTADEAASYAKHCLL